MAGSNYFTIELSGKGSHAAAPASGNDLPLVAARVTEALASLAGRRLDVIRRPAVISVTRLEAGGERALNVLPPSAVVAGTIRAFEDIDSPPGEGQSSIRELLEETVRGIALAHGVEVEIRLRKASPPTINDPALEAALVPSLLRLLPGQLEVNLERGMFSEDFSYYTATFPSLYFGLGVAKDGLGEAGVHTAEFTLHPEALQQGIALLVSLAHVATTEPIASSVRSHGDQ